MISQQTLNQAITRGVISEDQSVALIGMEEAFKARGQYPAGAAIRGAEDENNKESIKLVSGMGDVFVVIGLVLLFFSTFIFLQDVQLPIDNNYKPMAINVFFVLLSWLLAEVFTRKRKMSLSSIVLLLVFCASFFVAFFDAFLFFSQGVVKSGSSITDFFTKETQDIIKLKTLQQEILWSIFATLFALMLHYRRFYVPLTAAIVAVFSFTLCAAWLNRFVPNLVSEHTSLFFLVVGSVMFLLALTLDLKDRLRVTGKAAAAFWLHIVAAPLLIHSFMNIFLEKNFDFNPQNTYKIVIIFLCIAVVSILIERRAILLSSLLYMGEALHSLLAQAGWTQAGMAGTAISLGGIILVMGALWSPLRAGIMRLLPAALRNKLPV